jgi:hypothetical protein
LFPCFHWFPLDVQWQVEKILVNFSIPDANALSLKNCWLALSRRRM